MNVLLDTNTLGRMAQPGHVQHRATVDSVTILIMGKAAHDTRLVAAMTLHGLTHILNFNTQDFARYTGITALDPAAIVVRAPAPPTP